MKVVQFNKRTYTTPWGHEFNSKQERDTFIKGAEWMAANQENNTEHLLNRLKDSEQ